MKPHENFSLENMEGEIWKDCAGFEDYYQVSNFGRVKTKRLNIIMRQRITDRYYKINLKIGRDTNKTYNIHRLVGDNFIPNPENKPEINHIDGDKKKNFASNLEWCTSKENKHHAIATGLSANPTGETNTNAFLKEKDVLEIRELHRLGIKSRVIKDKFNLKQSHFSHIIRRVIWKHI